MQNVVDLFSSLLAVSQAQTTCPIHEDCDGSCTGQQIVYQPLTTDNPEAAVIKAPRPRQLDAGVFCRDASWLAEQDLDPFEYAPIDSNRNMIRVLRVKSADYRNDVIECEILEACLDDHPTYAALSYY